MKHNVLLTYSWVRSTYVALRSLNSLGLSVAVCDESRIGMGQWSKYSYFAGKYSCPLTMPESFISDIVNYLEKTGATFLLPSHDETEVLAKYRQDLPKKIILPINDYLSIKNANDKGWMADFVINLGLPVPKTIMWNSVETLGNKLESSVDQHYVIKLRKGNSSKGVFFPANNSDVIDEVKRLMKQYKLSTDRKPVIQERVEGEGWGVSCLYWEGKRVAFFTHKRLKEKIKTGGTSTLRVSIRNPILEEIAFEILDKMEWHGLAMVEFKFNPLTGQAWFIEVNPRLWGSIHLAVQSGVDFPALLYTAATKGFSAAKEKTIVQ